MIKYLHHLPCCLKKYLLSLGIYRQQSSINWRNLIRSKFRSSTSMIYNVIFSFSNEFSEQPGVPFSQKHEMKNKNFQQCVLD